MQTNKWLWEQMDDFHRLSEFKRFEQWMNEQIAANGQSKFQ
jgi:hypothetical protein